MKPHGIQRRSNRNAGCDAKQAETFPYPVLSDVSPALCATKSFPGFSREPSNHLTNKNGRISHQAGKTFLHRLSKCAEGCRLPSRSPAAGPLFLGPLAAPAVLHPPPRLRPAQEHL